MSQRLFVGNLPVGTTADDLKQEFNAYGTVKDVEVKIKENLVDANNPNVFAFVTLDINQQTIKQCIEEFSQQQYRGRYLSVSIAKESFLERLKREREEANSKNFKKSENVRKDSATVNQIESKKNESHLQIKKEVSSSSSESESDSGCGSEDKQQKSFQKRISTVNGLKEPSVVNNEEEEAIFITKKKASNSLQNGKIRIQHTSNEPIHVISKKLKDVKQFDEKARISDLKRKESLNKMKDQYNQQKSAIQKALSSVDTNKSKKIVFNDDENNDNEEIQQVNKKLNLFEGENDDKDEIENYKKDFEIKKQYEGKGGEKLMKLQTKFKLDPRFQMDERFLDDGDDGDEKRNVAMSDKNKMKSSNDGDVQNEDERKWQLGIIEKVIGRKLDILPESHKKKLQKTMLRYDPTKQEDQKFVKNIEKIAESISEEKESNEKQEIEVSKEQFYTVNEDLTKSLKHKSDGFSLLSLFRRSEDEENINNSSITKTENILDVKTLLMTKSNSHIDNPFKYDSSESETEDEDSATKNKRQESMDIDDNDNSKVVKTPSSSFGGKTTKTGVWNENFFIFEKDQRLKDGVAFFKKCKDNGEPKEDYDNVRDKLRLIIKKKIVKSRRNMKEKKTRKGILFIPDPPIFILNNRILSIIQQKHPSNID